MVLIIEIFSYQELLGKEAEVIGCSDHLLSELLLLVEFVRRKKPDLSQVITKKYPWMLFLLIK